MGGGGGYVVVEEEEEGKERISTSGLEGGRLEVDGSDGGRGGKATGGDGLVSIGRSTGGDDLEEGEDDMWTSWSTLGGAVAVAVDIGGGGLGALGKVSLASDLSCTSEYVLETGRSVNLSPSQSKTAR